MLSVDVMADFTDRIHAEFVIPERAYVGACRCLIVTNLNVLPSTHNMFTFCFVDALHFKLFFIMFTLWFIGANSSST